MTVIKRSILACGQIVVGFFVTVIYPHRRERKLYIRFGDLLFFVITGNASVETKIGGSVSIHIDISAIFDGRIVEQSEGDPYFSRIMSFIKAYKHILGGSDKPEKVVVYRNNPVRISHFLKYFVQLSKRNDLL